jgi:hypothetical protein
MSNEITILCPALVLSNPLRVKEKKAKVNPFKKTIKNHQHRALIVYQLMEADGEGKCWVGNVTVECGCIRV